MKTNRRVLALAFSLLFPVWGGASSPPDTGSRDGRLLAQGQEKLAHAKVGDKVDLKVENAAATLSGTVDSIAVKERASKEILKVPGIVITMKLPSSNSRDAKGNGIWDALMYSHMSLSGNNPGLTAERQQRSLIPLLDCHTPGQSLGK